MTLILGRPQPATTPPPATPVRPPVAEPYQQITCPTCRGRTAGQCPACVGLGYQLVCVYS